MWSDIIPATSWMLVYLLLVMLVFYRVQAANIRKTVRGRAVGRGRWAGIIVLTIALAVRLLPMVILPVGTRYDVASFRIVADAVLARAEVYQASLGRHPYLPFQMYVIGAALWASNALSIPFVVMVKLPAVLADVGVTAVIYQSCRRWEKPVQAAAFWALLYALNPISILVSAYHGQFDAIPVLLLLLAWYFWHFEKRVVKSAVALGFAILNKTWPIVFLPVVLIRLRHSRPRLIYTAIALLIPITFTVAYLLAFDVSPTVMRRPLTHTGVNGYWGLSAVIAVVNKILGGLEGVYTTLLDMRRWLILFAGVAALWITRRQRSIDALTSIILSVFAVSVGMGIQWLLWVVPFALLAGDHRGLRWYSLTGSLFLLVQLYGLHMYPWANELLGVEKADILIRLGSVPAWITVVLWTGYRLWGENGGRNGRLSVPLRLFETTHRNRRK